MMTDCLFVTCAQVPNLDPDDRLVLLELERRGFTTAAGVWSDPNVDWSGARLCVVRSTWDYHQTYDAFVAWIERVAEQTTLRNERGLLRWNVDKSYLFDLQASGVPIVPTVRVARGRSYPLAAIAGDRGWSELVLKPSRGAAAHEVLHVRQDAACRRAGQAHIDRLTAEHDALVQPYLNSVETYGERALIFFNGRYSHAASKKPFDRVWVVNGAESVRVIATAEEVAIASRAIAILPVTPLYARVDLLHGDAGETYVSEVELVEPGLYIGAHAPAAKTFADAIEHQINLVATNP